MSFQRSSAMTSQFFSKLGFSQISTIFSQKAIRMPSGSKNIQIVQPYLAVSSIFQQPSRLFASAGNLDDAEKTRIAKMTSGSRVVVLMKGTPKEPRCGFSNAVCRILEAHGVLEKKDAKGLPLLSSFNVLEDDALREGAKIFSDWPTFPQVYVDGEFMGGCDILLDMHRSGKLTAELERLGIGSTLKVEEGDEKKTE